LRARHATGAEFFGPGSTIGAFARSRSVLTADFDLGLPVRRGTVKSDGTGTVKPVALVIFPQIGRVNRLAAPGSGPKNPMDTLNPVPGVGIQRNKDAASRLRFGFRENR
jgi:hypothetical protein